MKRIDVLPKSRRWMLLTIFLLTLGLLKTFADRKPHHAAQPSPSLPTPTINSPNIPADVANPPSITTFDDYSWRAFLAMVWPVQQGQRGAPDATQTVDGPGPRVFETYKALWEVFHEDGSASLRHVLPAELQALFPTLPQETHDEPAF